jgi:hypothetical protein
MWGRIIENPKSHGFANPLYTLYMARNTTYTKEMGSKAFGDVRAPGHEKITHGTAAHAKAHFVWKDNGYTGMFTQADNCVIRIANAAAPTKLFLNPTSYGPNMAIKCFRDGTATPSANLQLIWAIDGYNVIPEGVKDSCSNFEVPMSNHCGRRDNITMSLKDVFIKDFDKVSNQSLMLGVSQMATGSQDGSTVDHPDFPFALVFLPNPKLNSIPCDFNNVTSQLQNIDPAEWVGQSLFDVFAVRDPWVSRPAGSPGPQLIGSLVLDSGFVTSMFGDTQLFFRHTFWEEEIETLFSQSATRAEQWLAYAKEWNKEEGAAWYWPYL